MTKILLVEDNLDLAIGLELNLKRKGTRFSRLPQEKTLSSLPSMTIRI